MQIGGNSVVSFAYLREGNPRTGFHGDGEDQSANHSAELINLLIRKLGE